MRWSRDFRNENEPLGKNIMDGQIMIANPWPKTTSLVEPGHRSPANRRLSKLPCPLLTR
jgi:hypothetical protein